MLRETDIDPFFMAENGNIAYISTDFGYKNSGENEIIILRDRQTEIVNTIVKDIGNYRP